MVGHLSSICFKDLCRKNKLFFATDCKLLDKPTKFCLVRLFSNQSKLETEKSVFKSFLFFQKLKHRKTSIPIIISTENEKLHVLRQLQIMSFYY
jgi:hypothetical protein